MDAAWAQVWATTGVGLLQGCLIAWGLWQMRLASVQRDRQLDIMAEDSRRQGQALVDIGQGLQDMAEDSRRQGQALVDIGQGLQELLRRPSAN